MKYISSRDLQEVINIIMKTRREAFHNCFSKHMERRRPYTCTMPIVRGTHVRWNSVTTIELPLLLLWRSTMTKMAPLDQRAESFSTASMAWIAFRVICKSPEMYYPHFCHGDAFIYNNQRRYSCVIFSKMNTLKVLESKI